MKPMSTRAIPGPPNDEPKRLEHDGDQSDNHHDGAHHGAAGYGDGPSSRGIPDADACLIAMAQLPGLVALKVLKPAQANSIRAAYRDILQHHQKNAPRDGEKRSTDVDVLELARKDPHIFSLLEPILTDEQIKMAMHDAKDGGGGKT